MPSRKLLIAVVLGAVTVAVLVGGTSASHKATEVEPIWQETYDGNGTETAGDVVQSDDGGYVFTGNTRYDVEVASDGPDETRTVTISRTWLVKTDGDGDEVWRRTYGSNNTTSDGNGVIQTSDGGYLVAGNWEKTIAGTNRAWLVKTDSQGNKVWNRTYGGSGINSFSDVVEMPGGGYAAIGETNAYGTGLRSNIWVVRVDENGDELWNRTYGGEGRALGKDIIVTEDGGLGLVGTTRDYNDYATEDSALLLTTDADGNVDVNETFGGPRVDRPAALVQHDGGFTVAGRTASNTEGGTNTDAWLVRFGDNGTMLWEQRYSQNASGIDRPDEIPSDLAVTSDGGYFVIGTQEPLEDVGALDNQVMLIRTAADGTQQWMNDYGGEGGDDAVGMAPTGDDQFVVAYNNLDENDSDVGLAAFDAPTELDEPSEPGTPDGSPTARSDGTPAGDSPTATPSSDGGDATPTPSDSSDDADGSDGGAAGDTAAGTETPGSSGPGFGVLVTLLGLVGAALLASRE